MLSCHPRRAQAPLHGGLAPHDTRSDPGGGFRAVQYTVPDRLEGNPWAQRRKMLNIMACVVSIGEDEQTDFTRGSRSERRYDWALQAYIQREYAEQTGTCHETYCSPHPSPVPPESLYVLCPGLQPPVALRRAFEAKFKEAARGRRVRLQR